MAACTLKLSQLISMSSQKKQNDDKKREVICGDSWFSNYRTDNAMSLEGFHYFGQVKMGHGRAPKLFLKTEMAGYCPVSWIVLKHTSPSNVEMVCIGYKYNRTKILTFIMMKGCGSTTSGPPYTVMYTQENGEKIQCDIARPEVVTDYFHATGSINHHNHTRQGTLALEEKWVTGCEYHRIFATFMGITATDSWLLWCYNVLQQLEGKRQRETP